MNGKYYNYKKLARKREQKYTQEEFAELLGTTIITISRMENGHNASYETVVKACKLLSINSSRIFYSSNELSLAT